MPFDFNLPNMGFMSDWINSLMNFMNHIPNMSQLDVMGGITIIMAVVVMGVSLYGIVEEQKASYKNVYRR